MRVSMKSNIFVCSILLWNAAEAKPPAPPEIKSSRPAPPEINISARVKQHRAGIHGDLVAGEEDARKLMLHWNHVPGASRFELCHMCVVLNGERVGGGDYGKVLDIDPTETCGGKPCGVIPKAPRGLNSIHIRARMTSADGTSDRWSSWSEPRNFDVQEPSRKVEHTSSEL
eukprot:CAMPEP_0194325860 /NCGR_PEP_ID=MMETSP0171-20130528/33210_1 /TAXON_ID=218684 /ORGANISM="Corethron pennatum, Strain L29A3" /LENGTH=170 /DNA_ID=CAMNT_0039085187 /DNA_START=91 /DNA_END=603 /DNA_ORIENTATION=-